MQSSMTETLGMAKSNPRLRDTSSVRGRMGPAGKKGPQIREEMIKDWKMKDRNAAVTKVKAAEETLEVDVVEGQGRGG